MPRINQLPAASSVAQTDVLAIDTPNKTYKVPRSVLAPAPYIATITTGQWSGSGSDRYITVTASNVTADAMLYPFYDNASAAMLNGPVWAIPADGSFTIHTSAIPSGTVTISVLLAGIVGEAQYQVLSDVYSKDQVNSIIAQSTAFASTTTTGLTAASNVTIIAQRYLTIGYLKVYSLIFTANAAFARDTALISGFFVGNMSQNGIPTVLAFNNASHATHVLYLSNGELRSNDAISNGEQLRCTLVYTA